MLAPFAKMIQLTERLKRITKDDEVLYIAELMEETLKHEGRFTLLAEIKRELEVSTHEILLTAQYLTFDIDGVGDLNFDQLSQIYNELSELKEEGVLSSFLTALPLDLEREEAVYEYPF